MSADSRTLYPPHGEGLPRPRTALPRMVILTSADGTRVVWTVIPPSGAVSNAGWQHTCRGKGSALPADPSRELAEYLASPGAFKKRDIEDGTAMRVESICGHVLYQWAGPSRPASVRCPKCGKWSVAP